MACLLEKEHAVTGLKWISLILLLLKGLQATAAVEPTAVPMQAKTFQAWKDLQVLEAQNQVLRIGARISQIKAGRASKTDLKDTSALPTSRVKSTTDNDPMTMAERDLRRARESLEAANSLELADYVNIYLPTLEAQPETLQVLLQKLSKEELGEILKLILQKNSHLDTKRNSPVVGGLSTGSSPAN